MAYFHGVSTRKEATSISTPVTAGAGIVFAVGTAPVHTVGGGVNVPVMANNYAEAAAALGFSDDWGKFTLCEVLYSQFQLYKVAPVFFVNVLDPTKHKKEVAAADLDVIDGKVLLPLEAIDSTVTVKESGGAAEYAADTDYALFYEGANLVLEVLDGGAIPAGTAKLNVAYNAVDPSKVTKAEIIGGFNVSTKQTTGLELIDSVFPKYGIVPDLVLAPGWSEDAEVAAIMSAKAEAINGVFKENKALIDVDTAEVRYYSDVPAWKKKKNITAPEQILCWPMVKLGDRTYHLSTQAAGLMGQVDADNGDCPCESPSNKKLQADSAILADGTEILLDLQGANYLNSQGIVTALNFYGGFKLWGNETACFPSNTDVTDYFICVGRMFGWVAKSVVLTYWDKVDNMLNRRLIDSIVDSLNIWLNGLVSEEKLLGGRVEFKEEENSTVSLMAGRATFHIYITPPSPAKELEFVLEYDAAYVSAALTA